MKSRPPARPLVLLLLLLTASTASAQQLGMPPGGSASDPPRLDSARTQSLNFGTTGLTYVWVNAFEFFPGATSFGETYYTAGGGRYPIGDPRLWATVHLPGGSILDFLEIDFCDSLDPQDILLTLIECDGGQCTNNLANVNSFADPGCSAISTSGINHTVDNRNHYLVLEATFQATNNVNLRLQGAVLGYRLQVSPAPPVATFVDVPPDNIYFQFIEALAASGITAGCSASPPQFCPDRPITRKEMAVFMAKALGLTFH